MHLKKGSKDPGEACGPWVTHPSREAVSTQIFDPFELDCSRFFVRKHLKSMSGKHLEQILLFHVCDLISGQLYIIAACSL